MNSSSPTSARRGCKQVTLERYFRSTNTLAGTSLPRRTMDERSTHPGVGIISEPARFSGVSRGNDGAIHVDVGHGGPDYGEYLSGEEDSINLDSSEDELDAKDSIVEDLHAMLMGLRASRYPGLLQDFVPRCCYHLQGRCRFGINCDFSHDDTKRGPCQFGDGCWLGHGDLPSSLLGRLGHTATMLR
ncbi:unnamed protein product [Symbiodinium sp. CCMP2592]|nr:unnamed protein product [Symbiodinium sp. CCMP2592]